jgi:prepilin-type N-terminal cleavage/methylation domain-containing protein
MLNRLRHDERGFTLPELLITCIIALTVSLAAFSLIDFVMRRSGEISVRVETTQRGRTGMDQMTRLLRSQVCAWRNDVTPVMDGARSLYAASPTSVTLFADFTNESAGAAPTLRNLTFTPDVKAGGTIVETATPGTTAGDRVSYAAGTPRTRQILSNVVLYRPSVNGVASGDELPLLRYYRFPNETEIAALPAGTTPLPNIPVGAGRDLTSDELEQVAKITIAFRVLPVKNKNSANYKGSQVLQNDIYVRTADPNAEVPAPTCAIT